MKEKTEDMRQLCDHAGAIINALRRKSSSELGMMKEKIAIIEQAKIGHRRNLLYTKHEKSQQICRIMRDRH